jgi:site-specific DNA-methyltransferase (adenine-specific)
MELNKIYNENCLDTMKRMPDDFIDLTVTSPPYDNLREYNGYSFDFESVAKELFRVTKKGGLIVWNVNDATVNGSETCASFRQALYFKEIGFNLHDTMIWLKPNPMPVSENQLRYSNAFEYIFILSKGKPNTFNPIREKSINFGNNSGTSGQRNKDGSKNERSKVNKILEYKIISNVWTFASAFSNESSKHPAPFPYKMASNNIFSWSNENDLIYDPFIGSGTTAKAAHLLKRNWIGSEISSEYVELANKRLWQYLNQTRLF